MHAIQRLKFNPFVWVFGLPIIAIDNARINNQYNQGFLNLEAKLLMSSEFVRPCVLYVGLD
jgi:hypothetical protein